MFWNKSENNVKKNHPLFHLDTHKPSSHYGEWKHWKLSDYNEEIPNIKSILDGDYKVIQTAGCWWVKVQSLYENRHWHF